MRGSLTGVLRVGAIPTALTVAPLLTTPFCQRHPHARITLESLPSLEITRRLAEFELDIAMTYVDDESDGKAIPLYQERYLLLTPNDGQFAERQSLRWAEAATVPLCLLSRQTRNRRILDETFAAVGATVVPAIETDTVSALYAHVASRQWSSVISHAWLHMFGVPQGMRVVRLDAVTRALESGQLAGYAGDVWFPQPAPADHPWRVMPHHGMTPHISGSTLSARARYAAGTREILENWFADQPIREEYLIVDGGKLAGAGAHSYSTTR